MSNESNEEDTLRPEYSAELIRSGERGKYVSRYRSSTNVVLIDPDLHRIFPDSASVNDALRKYAEEHHKIAQSGFDGVWYPTVFWHDSANGFNANPPQDL